MKQFNQEIMAKPWIINPAWEACKDSPMRFLFDDPDMYKAINIGRRTLI